LLITYTASAPTTRSPSGGCTYQWTGY
jgi:hypothetical protein